MDNKWWEYYAVRYFVGTVIGAVIVAFLSSTPLYSSLGILKEAEKSAFLGISLVAALGFAFCYLSSAPVLALHATRAHLRQKGKRLLSLTCIALSALITYFCLNDLPSIARAGFSLAFGIQIGLVIAVVFDRCGVLETFYRELATSRAKIWPQKDSPATPGVEYVTSYRHLREHGNAFLIVLFEGLLAYLLFSSPSLPVSALLLALWTLPAAAVWLIATALESRFVETQL